MSIPKNDEASLKERYAILSKQYEILGKKLKSSLEKVLKKNGISFLAVDFRIKTFESFCQKLKKYNYGDPFNQITDHCALRIICYYYSDLLRINQLIKEEFPKNQLLEIDIKISDIDVMKFSYRSWHYLVKFNEEWLKEIGDKTYSNFRAEIQLRTSIMHTWAEVEHDIFYKQDIPISDGIKRRLSRISALLEMVDEQFDRLREEKRQHLDSLTFKPRVDIENLELTFENFQQLLDIYYPYRPVAVQNSMVLYYKIIQSKITIKDLVKLINRTKEILSVLEEDIRKIFLAQNKFVTAEEMLLKTIPLKQTQDGALKVVLLIFHDGFWESERGEISDVWANFIIKWRSKLREF
ncbi:MAG: GTP pyrophosphokinase [Candidatus Hodarchaeales archaeon]|jgi:ppGpp synthetase/RelA/SpoT-type nucleotidyltranferase